MRKVPKLIRPSTRTRDIAPQQMLFLFAFVMTLLFSTASSLTCYDSSSLAGEERPLTQTPCAVNTVCMYYESTVIDGYVQQCATVNTCSNQQDNSLLKNVECCSNDLCNAAGDQPSSSSSLAPSNCAVWLSLLAFFALKENFSFQQ